MTVKWFCGTQMMDSIFGNLKDTRRPYLVSHLLRTVVPHCRVVMTTSSVSGASKPGEGYDASRVIPKPCGVSLIHRMDFAPFLEAKMGHYACGGCQRSDR